MDRYTIYCTSEQTKKALELGAPIEFELECPVNLDTLERSPYPDIKMDKDGEPILINPTAEEMIGWLEDQYSISEIDVFSRINKQWSFVIFLSCNNIITGNYKSRKEALSLPLIQHWSIYAIR